MANFTTAFVKVAALNADIDSRQLTPGLKALVDEMIARKTEGLTDPKASVHVMSPSDSAVTVIVNVMAKPGDHWPGEAE